MGGGGCSVHADGETSKSGLFEAHDYFACK